MVSAATLSPAHPPAPFALTAADAARLTGGRWLGATREAVIRGATCDSRELSRGCLFACIAGARVDGHDFAVAAASAGAALVLAARELELSCPVLVVEDVTLALGALAAEQRRRLDATTWVGITGSNGKTTVKELVAAACSAHGATHATRGNLNNHLGVPLSVLATPEGARYAIIEMGANHQREIAGLAAISQPQVGAITAIGPAHLEGFGGIEGVARGKSEMFAALPAGATAVLGVAGLDMVAARHGTTTARLLAPAREAAAGRRLVLVGSPECPVEGTVDDDGLTLRTPAGPARLPLLGAHNLANAALAYQVALAAGVPPERALAGLAAVRAVPGRLALRRVGEHRLIDDSYNANPGSMIAGLHVLAARPGRRLAILGAMGELGDDREHGHRLVGAEAARLALPLIVVGEKAALIAEAYRGAGGQECTSVATREDAVTSALDFLKAGPTSVLVKASRSAGLDAVVDGLAKAIPC